MAKFKPKYLTVDPAYGACCLWSRQKKKKLTLSLDKDGMWGFWGESGFDFSREEDYVVLDTWMESLIPSAVRKAALSKPQPIKVRVTKR